MSDKSLKIVSLNIQHGWNTGLSHPLPISRRQILANLEKIGLLLKPHTPDIVLLQEVERMSPLTRNIDQLGYIAEMLGCEHIAHAASSQFRFGKKIMYAAGCGIISRYPILETEGIKFEPSFPTPRKGFLVATLVLSQGAKLTVVSTHLEPLDLLNARAKRGQIDAMIKALENKGPIVLGGDFNSAAHGRGHTYIQTLASKLNLVTHEDTAHNPGLYTYPSRKPRKRIDWIFASRDLKMSEYRILDGHVSDHLAIGTTVSF